MKKSIISLVVLLMASFSAKALVYTVFVPEGTQACYIARDMNSWTHEPMTQDPSYPTKFTIDIPGATESHVYKYCCGANWAWVEKDEWGGDIGNRPYSSIDYVDRWANVVTLEVEVPAGTRACYVAGSWETPWNEIWEQMFQKGETTYTLILPAPLPLDQTTLYYKYCSGFRSDWYYVEVYGPSNRECGVNYNTVYQTVSSWEHPVCQDFTYELHVTVPSGTEACYVYGSWNDWTPQLMNQDDATHYSLPSFSAEFGQIQYKYCSGPDWKYEELEADGSWKSNRKLLVSASPLVDEVVRWKEIYEPKSFTLNVTVPPGTGACYVAGSWNNWTPEPMESASAPYDYTLIVAAGSEAIEYKYCSGPGWQYEELNSDYSPMDNRTLSASSSADNVEKWKNGYEPKFVEFKKPANAVLVVDPGASIDFLAEAVASTTLDLYFSEKGSGAEASFTTSIFDTSISASYTFNNTPGSYWVIAVAGTYPGTDRDSVFVVVKSPVQISSRPSSLPDGINVESPTQVTFILCAPGKDNVFVVGDFNDWLPENGYMMKQDGDYWWLTVSGLSPNVEYAFQYLVDGKLYVGDPYAEKILDPWNDKAIPSATYPDLKPYPRGKNFDDGPVSVFQTNEPEYDWQYSDGFIPPRQDKLVIYELLIRDFSKEGNLEGVIAKLDYLQELGINAIELMPTQEFDGNDSWGYNPCYFFAMDKAYGTKAKYQEFIDECHKRGIAVILDVVYNHATGQCPLAKLYWDKAANQTTSDNPWFNVEAPHAWAFYHDFNHTEPWVKEFFNRNLKFLLTEYKFDGFRFDMTKGFTQTSKYGSNDNFDYDGDRVVILQGYYDAITSANVNACMIIEHLCGEQEEKALADHVGGMMPWARKDVEYGQAIMGWQANSDFNGVNGWTRVPPPNDWTFNNLVGYMESHDEERLMVTAQQSYAHNVVQGSLEVQLKRAALCAAFFLPLPGAKMIWQFGELGYDYSIDYNGRTGRKPLVWDLEYDKNDDRKALYDTYAKLIKLRDYYDYEGKTKDAFENRDWWNEQIGGGDWWAGKRICLNSPNFKMVILGNFEPDPAYNSATSSNTNPDGTLNTYPNFPVAGTWYNYMTGEEMEVTSSDLPANEFDLGMAIPLAPHEFQIWILKDEFTWKQTAADNTWNDTNNWEEGNIPHKASFVTIPGGATNYPILQPTDEAKVHSILFKPRAELGNQHLLDYQKAYVQLDFGTNPTSLSRDRWWMLTNPLQELYAGDFTFGGLPEMAIQQYANAEGLNNSEGLGEWTSLNYGDKLEAGDSFALWLRSYPDDSPIDVKGLNVAGGIITLPYFENPDEVDVHWTHEYNSSTFQSTFYGWNEGVFTLKNDPSAPVVYRTPAAYKLVELPVLTKDLDFGLGESGNFYYAATGNPFMSSIDFTQLLSKNTGLVGISDNYWVWVGAGDDDETTPGSYAIYNKTGGYGGPTFLSNTIPPMQSFIVENIDGIPSTPEITFNISEISATGNADGLRATAPSNDLLEIIASTPKAAVRAVIASHEQGSPVFSRKDGRKLLAGINSLPEIYLLKPATDNRIVKVAADIVNEIEAEWMIPLGIATTYEGPITLSFAGMDSYNARIFLIDTASPDKQEIELTGKAKYEYTFDYKPEIVKGTAVSNENRFFILLAPTVTTGIEQPAALSKILVYSNRESTIQALSGEWIQQVSVFNIQGQKIYDNATVNAREHTVTGLVPGVYAATVVTKNEVKTAKIIVR